MKPRPAMFVWTDADTMVPVERFVPMCRRQFVVGQEYALEPVAERSMKSHNHYFATLSEMYDNLPEPVAKRFPTFDHFRGWCLVQTGFAHEKVYACDSNKLARQLAAGIRSFAEYAVISISDNVVHVFEPMSQSIAAMGGGDRWRESKEAVLNLAESMNPGLTRKVAEREAARKVPRERRQPATPEPISPRTAPAYYAYARAWIALATDREAAWARWSDEQQMRDRLRVSLANREELENLIRHQFEKDKRGRADEQAI